MNGDGEPRKVPGGLVDEALTESVIRAFYTVYNKLGYGFLENVYCGTLEVELRKRGN